MVTARPYTLADHTAISSIPPRKKSCSRSIRNVLRLANSGYNCGQKVLNVSLNVNVFGIHFGIKYNGRIKLFITTYVFDHAEMFTESETKYTAKYHIHYRRYMYFMYSSKAILYFL